MTLRTETAYKYRNTISEIDLFITGHRLQLSDLNIAMVADFTVELLRRGLATNTVIRHLNIFNSLVKWAASNGMMSTCNAPRDMARILTDSSVTSDSKAVSDGKANCDKAHSHNSKGTDLKRARSGVNGTLPPLMREQEFDGLLRGLRKDLRGSGGHDVFTDVLLFSLLNGAMSIKDVVMLKKEEIGNYNEASRYVAERNRSNDRKYVFDLKQSYQTPKQVYKVVEKELKERYGKFAVAYMPVDGASSLAVSKMGRSVSGKAASKSAVRKDSKAVAFDVDDLVRSIWVAMAIKSGATASEALACQTAPAPYALPKFCDSIYTEGRKNAGGEGDTNVNESVRILWERSVTTMLTSDLPRWYAMHLRKGVSYDELRKEIAEGIHPAPELFYPSETIKKRIGSRTVIDDKPFITSTVFFKTYPEKILPMFSRIGDKAWCYRVTRGAGSPYAVISSSDMSRFQSVIGIFTPDIEIHPLGELTPKPGESVIIIKAGYNNRQGEVEEVINTESGSAIFRIKLSTDQGYEWRVDLDPHQIERLLK
ncbi:MAG: phage integrase SAM-like domain-containing protein [Muribaculaceae bacterium]|nr:phage integrase SAM-like domain-containing protein [Muribaculaceae bacterium]